MEAVAVFLRVRLVQAAGDRADLGGELLLFFHHPRVAHRFVPRGVGSDLCAVDRNQTESYQCSFARHRHGVAEQLGEILRVSHPETIDRAESGTLGVAAQMPEPQVSLETARDLAAGVDSQGDPEKPDSQP